MANKAQDGRGSITTTRIPTLITLDPRTVKLGCSEKAAVFYGTIKHKTLLPAHNLSTDPVRAELDEFVLRELVDCGPKLSTMVNMIEVLRKKLRAEPSFNGGR
jgi:hypothetical protein